MPDWPQLSFVLATTCRGPRSTIADFVTFVLVRVEAASGTVFFIKHQRVKPQLLGPVDLAVINDTTRRWGHPEGKTVVHHAKF